MLLKKLFAVLFICVPVFLFAVPPLKVASPEEARKNLIDAATKYGGAPYRYGGQDAAGFDCSGLIFRSFKDALNVQVPRTAQTLHAWAEPMAESQLQPGDLVFFSTTGAISHVGIYLGDGLFIHSASEGISTGVIISNLDENYWRRTFASAGRAIPAVGDAAAVQITPEQESDQPSDPSGKKSSEKDDGQSRFLLGFGGAPTWTMFAGTDSLLRGAAFQFRAAYDIPVSDFVFRLGAELRPEWDGALGVFRMPLTLSLGIGDRFRIFAGPAFTLGDPELSGRSYTGGTAWLGTVGIYCAPVIFDVGKGKLSLYAEAAWQSYFKESGLETNWSADLGAALRVSTGIMYTWGL
ncbi:C40 family peptidase [Treponema sp. OttesenSCG-928-L16]|nr:C40 family peptidase [Treponema sp. OttesenSCG-928-L16]